MNREEMAGLIAKGTREGQTAYTIADKIIAGYTKSKFDVEVCEWKIDKEKGYHSTCGEFIEFIAFVSIPSTDFKYCPFCGNKIKEIEG